jgi:hypothetical protein
MKKLLITFLLLSSWSAVALPAGALPPGEGGGDFELSELFEDREVRLPSNTGKILGLVPLNDEVDPVPEEEGVSAALPPIMIVARVKTYHKVPVARRRRSLSSRGGNPVKGQDSDLIYKTVSRVQKQQVNISPLIEKYATKYNLDPWLVRGVIQVESNFRPYAMSPVGAGGLMQLMPGTASYLGCQDRFDPEQNIAAGARYLRMMLDRFGETDLMIAAYNAGPGNVERYGGVPPFAETQRYVVKVNKAWKQGRKSVHQ